MKIFESLADKIPENLDSHKWEDFHEFLRTYVDIFTKNVYATTNYTCKHLKRIIKDPNLVAVSVDKKSCLVIKNKGDYQNEMKQMINDGIRDGISEVTADNTLDDLKTFQSFLYHNFYGKYEHFEKMLPKSNQPGQLYGTAKTHKFSSIDDITLENLKFRPIITQSGTYTYNVAQVIADYLKPLCSDNDCIMRNTQEFLKLLQQQDPLLPNDEYVSYDVKSLFAIVPIQEKIDYILDEIYVKNKLPKICSKLIFKRLLSKLTTENTFMFTSSFYKQIDVCTMGGPLSVIFSDIYITKTEREVVNQSEPKFQKRFVGDTINRRNKNEPDDLFQKLNNNHPNMKYTVEVKPEIFLDTKTVYSNDVITTEVKRNDRKLPVHWSSKVPKWYKRNAIISDLNRATRIASFPADEN